MPTLPAEKVGSGWKPIRHLPMGEIIPGALAPTRRDFDCVLNMEWICYELVWTIINPKKMRIHPQQIMDWYMLGDCDDKGDFSFDCLLNCRGSLMSRDIYCSGIRFQLRFSLYENGDQS